MIEKRFVIGFIIGLEYVCFGLGVLSVVSWLHLDERIFLASAIGLLFSTPVLAGFRIIVEAAIKYLDKTDSEKPDKKD